MFERDDNVGAGQELVFRRYASFEDMLGNVDGIDTFSPIDLAANFSSRGLMAQVDFGGGGEPPAPVPLPPALALMMAGLAGLAGAGRQTSTRRAGRGGGSRRHRDRRSGRRDERQTETGRPVARRGPDGGLTWRKWQK